MRSCIPIAVSIVLTGPALAAEVKLNVEIPQLAVAEYHKPYLAIWIEQHGQPSLTNLAIWYDVNNAKNEGDKWLKDLRQWWRRSGRELSMPVDGITGATRAPGTHLVELDGVGAFSGELSPGDYRLVVEAAREVGGREVVQIHFAWPPQAPAKLSAAGNAELGQVVLELKP
jgi:hypothetical protein